MQNIENEKRKTFLALSKTSKWAFADCLLRPIGCSKVLRFGRNPSPLQRCPQLAQGGRETETLEIESATHLLQRGFGPIKARFPFSSENWVSGIWGSQSLFVFSVLSSLKFVFSAQRD